ncbi:MAG: hypothetical protein [Circular genetic element sp.]|jgi:hypothetical protein|nr:MAG: hypothetical protein [Circular genetic element sp.]|tara:strand:+ start:824 stop:1261 length:438 start_codon:yes stop_codon:yes gene_type:complete
MKIKSFRGKLKSQTSETIHLHTNTGTTGYRIIKFELMSTQPGAVDGEHIAQIFTVPKTDTSLYDNIDFSDQTLLASGYISTDSSEVNADSRTVIFDNVTFNQDIYVVHTDVKSGLPVNYHIELEQVSLDLNENTVATLKDIRNLS